MGLATWLKILALVSDLVAIFKSWRERKAGRKEVVLDVKENSADAQQKADAARIAVGDSIASGGLRDDDGYRRD